MMIMMSLMMELGSSARVEKVLRVLKDKVKEEREKESEIQFYAFIFHNSPSKIFFTIRHMENIANCISLKANMLTTHIWCLLPKISLAHDSLHVCWTISAKNLAKPVFLSPCMLTSLFARYFLVYEKNFWGEKLRRVMLTR